MAIILLVYTIPVFFFVMALARLIPHLHQPKEKVDVMGVSIYFIAAIIWFLLVFVFMGTPSKFMRDLADKKNKDNDIINNCRLVESGRKGGLLSPDQDGYLCKDGVIHYIDSRK
ncbi:hypothetical protein ACK3OH_004525 [Salmonella enterica]